MAEDSILQWVKFGLAVPGVYLNGPELVGLLREAGEDEAAELVELHVRAIEAEQVPPGRVNGIEGPS